MRQLSCDAMNGPREQPDGGMPALDWGAELERHRRWLRTVLLARTGDASVVDDLWQQTALAAVRSGLAPGGGAAGGRAAVDNVGPWLYRVALRQVLQHRRKCGRERRRDQRYAEEVRADDAGGDPLEWLLADETRSLVRQALRVLESQDAEILMLKYTEEWTYRQIGEHLGVTESAVESRLFRARSRLRRELATLVEPAPAK